MRIVDTFLAEIDQEAKTTRRMLERVPEHKLMWKPHPKSMTLGELALHVAGINAMIANLGDTDVFSVDPSMLVPVQPKDKAEILEAFESGLVKAKGMLDGVDDPRITATWSLAMGGNTLMSMPRAGLYRALMCSHQYHHRGQLSVYLRMLDVPLPSIYGPSADENPFMK